MFSVKINVSNCLLTPQSKRAHRLGGLESPIKMITKFM